MGKLQNGTKQLVNEKKKKKMCGMVFRTSSATKNTKDFLKNLDKRVTETSNKVKALEKEINNCLSFRIDRFNYESSVKEVEFTILRNKTA